MKTKATKLCLLGLVWLANCLTLTSCEKKPEAQPESEFKSFEQEQRVAPQPDPQQDVQMRQEERGQEGEAGSFSLDNEMNELKDNLAQLENRIEGAGDKTKQEYQESIEKLKSLQQRAEQQVEQTAKTMKNQSIEAQKSMKEGAQNALNELNDSIDNLQKQLDDEQK